MKQLPLLIILAILAISCNQPTNSNNEEDSSIENKYYTEAMTYIQSFESNQNLDSVVLDGEDYLEYNTDNGAILTGYYQDDNLVKITQNLGLSLGFVDTEYFLKDDKLYIVRESERTFPEMKDESGNITGLDYSDLQENYQKLIITEGNITMDTLLMGKKVVSPQNRTHSEDLSNLKIALDAFKKNALSYELIQGKWKSVDDELYINEFRDRTITEIYDNEIMSEESFSIAGDRLIYSEDLYYSIVKLDSDSLILIFPARGNTLKYYKI